MQLCKSHETRCIHICHLVLHHRDYTLVTDFVTDDYYFYTKNYICIISSP